MSYCSKATNLNRAGSLATEAKIVQRLGRQFLSPKPSRSGYSDTRRLAPRRCLFHPAAVVSQFMINHAHNPFLAANLRLVINQAKTLCQFQNVGSGCSVSATIDLIASRSARGMCLNADSRALKFCQMRFSTRLRTGSAKPANAGE